jgi:hypothetical protein
MGFAGFIFLLLGLSHPVPVRAETTVYILDRALEVPPPVMLLVGGLATIAVGIFIRRWFGTQPPEPGPDDINVTGPLPEMSSAMIDLPAADHEHADRTRQKLRALPPKRVPHSRASPGSC